MRRTVVAAIGGIALAWIALTALVGVAVDDGVCSTACHSMRAYEATADGSAHASVGCRTCHASPGPVGFLADGFAMQRRAVATLTGRGPALASVSDAACRTCHAGTARGTLEAGGIAVRHSDFWDADCTDCHGGTAHAVEGRRYPVPEMDDCLECHSASASEPSQCRLCHVPGTRKDRAGDPSWSVTHGAGWEKTHGMGDRSTCVSCHEPRYCARCHGVALPHPVDWPRVHGRSGARTELESCRTCHDPSWCVDCHGIEMPHPDRFLPSHGPESERLGGSTCVRCHSQEACDDCHIRSAHPDIPGGGATHEVAR